MKQKTLKPENIQSLIDDIQRELSAYIYNRSTRYSYYTNCDGRDIEYTRLQPITFSNSDQRIARYYKNDSWRNDKLTVARLNSSIATFNRISDLKNNIATNGLTGSVNFLHKELESTYATNSSLSTQYGKTHRTLRDSRRLGSNILTAFFRKTFRQSNAQQALDRSLSMLEKFTDKFNIKLEPSEPVQVGHKLS